jgi:hypothetical protein
MEILNQEVERGWWDAEVVARLTDLNVSEDDFAPV